MLAGRKPGLLLAFEHAIADKLVFVKIRAAVGGRLRFFVSGGAPLSPEINRFFFAAGLKILEGYGLTETSPVIAVNTPRNLTIGTVGPPIPGVEVKVAADGEILTRGPHVMKGYFNHPEATAEAIDADGWFYTGDIGTLENGLLRITDRKKDIIVTAGGENVTPSNLENGLKSSPYVAEACVLGDRRPYLIALVTLDAEELARFATAHDLAGDHAALCRAPAIGALVDAQLAVVNADVARVAQIKRYRILTDRFSQETGELTPTLKLKRKVIAERYAADIDELYSVR